MDYDQAIYYFEQAISADPRMMDIRPQLGFCYLRAGRHDDAVKVCLNEISRFSQSLQSRILMAYVYFLQGKHEEAALACEDYNKSLDYYCLDEAEKIEKGFKVREDGKWVLSRENLEVLRIKIRERQPNLGLPFFIYGFLQKKMSRFDKASHYIHQSLQWGYNPVECLIQMIDIYLAQGNWPLAVTQARDGQRIVGSQAELFFLMGYAFYEMGQMEDAEMSFSKAFDLKPHMMETLKNLAKVHLVQGHFQEAARQFRQIMKVFPFDYNVRFLLDRAQHQQSIQKPEHRPSLTKNFVEQIKPIYTYTFATDIGPVINLINSAAVTLLRNGRLDEAIMMTASFLELYSDSPELNYNLAHYYNMKNDLNKALKYAWTSVILNEDFKDAYDLVGNIFFKMEDYDNAIKAYGQVISIDSKDAMSHYNLGCVYSAKGELRKAEESWLNAIRYEQSERSTVKDKGSDDELSYSIVVVGRRVAFKSHMSLGHIYRDQNHWDKALEHYQKALELEANRSELYYEMGKIYLKKPNIEEAKKCFDRYLYLGGDKEAEVKHFLDHLKKNQREKK